jgi:hypothetical protein
MRRLRERQRAARLAPIAELYKSGRIHHDGKPPQR